MFPADVGEEPVARALDEAALSVQKPRVALARFMIAERETHGLTKGGSRASLKRRWARFTPGGLSARVGPFSTAKLGPLR